MADVITDSPSEDETGEDDEEKDDDGGCASLPGGAVGLGVVLVGAAALLGRLEA